MKKFTTFLLFIVTFNAANAGFNGLTHHSRANCVNNESISWDWTTNHWFLVYSAHHNAKTGALVHEITLPWQYTWRAAAVHWGEGRGGWSVFGRHWMKDKKGKQYFVQQEKVTDCSIYDGWWDKNK